MKHENLTLEQLEMVNGGGFFDSIKDAIMDAAPKLVTNPIVIWVNDKYQGIKKAWDEWDEKNAEAEEKLRRMCESGGREG